MLSDPRQSDKVMGVVNTSDVTRTVVTLAVALGLAAIAPLGARAIGETTLFDVRQVAFDDASDRPRESAARRLAWEVRKRTSIETRLRPTRARLDDPSIFETPFLYWAGDQAFPPISEGEISGLRRFVEFGGFVLVDDASPDGSGFDESIQREVARAFPEQRFGTLPASHTIYRSFYLLDRPVGRVAGPREVRAIEHGGRAALVYSRHDLGGAWARDNLGTWEHAVIPGGDRQRERAIRFGVNLVMYALCLDYKDDQVHAPFIMRRRGSMP
ncbi:MAG: hypothetical protein DRJ42_13210 [Deltaproteobacteria bacterium]|nr:MAG: hypothetical protein DRJ42_13210 [Deltaproteobacteria bacterium]